MFKKLRAFLSLFLFIAFIVLVILQFLGQSNFIVDSFSRYLDFVKHGQILIVIAVIVLSCLFFSSIVAFGSGRDTFVLKKVSTSRIFWITFTTIFLAQFFITLLWRSD
jgi:hypothetical protein